MNGFLDTSIVRALTHSSDAYKEYVLEEIKDKKNVCNYVEMEYRRGFIIPLLRFCNYFDYPKVKTFEDLVYFVTHEFGDRPIKTFIYSILSWIKDSDFNFSKINELDDIQREYATIIEMKYHELKKKFHQIESDRSLCNRTKSRFVLDTTKVSESIVEYINSFTDNSNVSKCGMNEFLKRMSINIELLKNSSSLAIKESNKKGFDSNIEALQEVQSKALTCTRCSKMGDLIISLICPKDSVLYHSDYSFDYLCKIQNKRNFRIKHEKVFLKEE